MIRSRLATAVPRRMLVLAAAALIAVLAGCEAGTNAPVDQWHQPTAGADAMFRNITISNVFVLGPAIGETLRPGGSASVFLALYNNGRADRLVHISAPGTAQSVTLPASVVPLGSNQGVLFTGPAPRVILKELTRPLSGGTTIRLVLTFQNAGSVTLNPPVMARAADYETFSPPPTPAPSPTTKPKASPSVSPGATPSPTPSATPTPTP